MPDRLLPLLDEPERQIWSQYLTLESQNRRQDALGVLREFVAALEAYPIARRNEFADAFCRLLVEDGVNIPVRQPLFDGLIGHYLVTIHEAKAPDALLWLLTFRLNFHGLLWRDIQESLSPVSEFALLHEILAREPANPVARQRLIKLHASNFRYAIHEVPAGVLYGQNGASIEECAEWLADLDEFRRLATEQGVFGEYVEQIPEWEFHFKGYADYLTNRALYRNYEHYIECRQAK